jgi:hypothetical protein
MISISLILDCADASGLLVAADIESVPHEKKLVEVTIDNCFTRYALDRLVGDEGYDSDSFH